MEVHNSMTTAFNYVTFHSFVGAVKLSRWHVFKTCNNGKCCQFWNV